MEDRRIAGDYGPYPDITTPKPVYDAAAALTQAKADRRALDAFPDMPGAGNEFSGGLFPDTPVDPGAGKRAELDRRVADAEAAYRKEEAKNKAAGAALRETQRALAALSDLETQGYTGPEAEAQRAHLEALEAQQEGKYRNRLKLGLESITETPGAAVGVLGDTLGQMTENTQDYQETPEVQALQKELSKLGGRLDYMARYQYPTRKAAMESEAYQEIAARMREISDRLRALQVDTPVPMDAPGMQAMTQAKEKGAEALEGLTPSARFLGSTAMSIGQNALLLPTAVINPAVPLIGMGAIATGDKTHALNARGAAPGEALGRGLVSGGIEAVTEKVPLDSLMDLMKTGGKGALRNLLKQAGVEATEEGLSYAANFVADKAAGDPEAEFSVMELLESAAAGGVSGLFFAGAGTLVHGAGWRAPSGGSSATSPTSGGGYPAGDGGSLSLSAARTAPSSEGALGDGVVSHTWGETQKTASQGETVKDYQKQEHHGTILDAIRTHLSDVKDMAPVKTLTGSEFQRTSGDTRSLRRKVIDFFDSLGNKVRRADIGEIELNTAGARDSLAHGYGKLKAATFAALPQVLEHGKIIMYNGPYEGHSYDSFIISAPVQVGEDTVYVGALVIKDRTQRYKLHEVLAASESGVSLFQSETTDQGADGPLRNDTPLEESVDPPVDTMIPQEWQGVKGQDAQVVEEIAGGTRKMPVGDFDYAGRADQVLSEGILDGEYRPAFERSALTYGQIEGALKQIAAGTEDGADAVVRQVKGILDGSGAYLPGGTPNSQTFGNLKPTEGPGDGDTRTQIERKVWEKTQQRKAEGPAAIDAETGRAYRGTPATEKLGLKVERPITDLGTAQSLRALEKARYEAGRALDRLMKESHATKADLEWAKLVVDGTMNLRQLPKGMNVGLISELADAVRLRNSYNSRAIQEQKARTNWNFDTQVDQMIAHSDQKTVPSTLSLNANTMQRNNVRVWGDDAGAINQELFDPVIVNEAERIRFVNRMLDQVEQYRLTAEESALVQKLMEGEVSREQLLAAGHDAERLEAAAKTMAGLYSDFYDAINDFLVAHGYKEIGFRRNYAPHMQEEQSTTLQRYLARMGFPVEVTELPTDLAGRTDTFRPGKQWDPYFQHRVGNETEFDAVGGFESYVNYLSNVLYHTDDIQKLRRFSDALRTKYGSEELGAELDRIAMLQDRVAAEDAGLEETDIQAMRDDAIQRYGNMSKFGDYVSVLDDYTNILAGKQSKFDRSMEALFGRKKLNIGRHIQNAFARSAILGNLSSAINQTVQIPQVVAEVGPKYTAQAVRDVVTGATGKTGFNQESDFLTGKTGIQSISAKSGYEKFFDVAAKPFEVVDDFSSRVIVRAKYLEQVAKGKSHEEALKAADTFANQVVGSRMRGAKPVLFENKNAIPKLVTTFQLEVANGWAHITQDLPMEIKTLDRTHGRGAAAKRVAQLVVASQLCNFIANVIIKSITGREPVPYDGLGMLANYMASGYGMTKEDYMKQVADSAAEAVSGTRPFGSERAQGSFDLPRAAKTLGEDALDDIPYLSNITSLLGITDGRLPLPTLWNKQLSGGVSKLGAAMFGDEEDGAETLKQGLLELGHGAALAGATWLPMGSQIKKTAQGITALAREGSFSGYGEGEKLQYAVDQNPANLVRGTLFGKSALPEADRYYAEGAKGLSEKQTTVYKRLIAQGADGSEVYTLIQNLRHTEKSGENSATLERLHVLQQSQLPVEQQAEIYAYAGLLASKEEMELIQLLEKQGADKGELYRVLSKITEANSLKGYQKSNAKRSAIQGANLPDAVKKAIYFDKIGGEREDDIRLATRSGLTFDDFLEAQNVYAEVGARDVRAAEQRTEFVRWMDSQSFTEDQRKVLTEIFRFSTFVPADETSYEKLLGAGVGEDTAYSISAALAGLRPHLGKQQVSSLQKSRVIVDSDATTEQQVAALELVMGESEYSKVRAAYISGVEPKCYVIFKERLALAAAGKSNPTQSDVEKVLQSMLLTNAQKAALWQLQNTGWKPWKNPYDPTVSQKVLSDYKWWAKVSEEGLLELSTDTDGTYLPTYAELEAMKGQGRGGGIFLPRA